MDNDELRDSLFDCVIDELGDDVVDAIRAEERDVIIEFLRSNEWMYETAEEAADAIENLEHYDEDSLH